MTADRRGPGPPHFFALQGRRIESLVEAGIDVVRLDVGSPDLPPPPGVVEVLAREAARDDAHAYQPHRGTGSYRRAWAERYREDHGVELDSERNVVGLLGTKEGIFHLPHVLAGPGDVVLVPDPGYATYRRGAESAGAEVVALPLSRGSGWLPDLDGVPGSVLERTRLLWLNYPNNPTGACADPGLFRQAVALAKRHGFVVAHDAAYVQVVWDGRAPSLLEVEGGTDVGVEFVSLSKAYHMAGWRVGAAVGQIAALEALHARKTQADSGHFRPILDAACRALSTPRAWLDHRNGLLRGRAERLVRGLRRLGLETDAPRGGMYVWSRTPPGWNAADFASAVLEHAHVAIAPGPVFGSGGEGWIRWALGATEHRLEAGLARLETLLQGPLRSPTGGGDPGALDDA